MQKPKQKFNSFFLAVFIQDYIMNLLTQDTNLSRPTATQCICWPVLLSKRDLIAVSNSAYGKHLAVNLIQISF